MTRLWMHVKVNIIVNVLVNTIVGVLNVFTVHNKYVQKKQFSSYHDHHHAQDDGGRVDEQIDKNTGAQVSAQALTWSYANVRTMQLSLGGQAIMFVFTNQHPHLAHHDDEQPLTTNNNLMTRSSTLCTPRRELPR